MFYFAWFAAAVGIKDDIQVCTEAPVDLTFLLDGSDSIDREDFDSIKNWTLQTVDAFDPSARRVPLLLSVVQFSEQSKIEVEQEVRSSSAEVAGQVYDIEQMRSGTKTYRALAFVNQNVYPTLRRNSYKILITMTDGDASEDRNQEAIDQAHQNFNMMIAVGVGRKVDEEELRDFSKRGYVITVENFNALEGIISSLKDIICRDIGESVEGIDLFQLIMRDKLKQNLLYITADLSFLALV